MGIPQVQNARRFQGPINWLFGENKVLHWSSGCSHWYLQDGLDFLSFLCYNFCVAL
jgi:hypothetical protein